MKPVNEKQRLWYRRAFKVPAPGRTAESCSTSRRRLESTVWSTARSSALTRRYDAFSYDITAALQDAQTRKSPSRLGPTDALSAARQASAQARRNLVHPVSGIWQTTWLEPVAQAHIESIQVRPDVDAGAAEVTVNC